ncbi:MAG: hypothetical protein ABH950_01960 [Candidatus Altiarchaeota archaeon]
MMRQSEVPGFSNIEIPPLSLDVLPWAHKSYELENVLKRMQAEGFYVHQLGSKRASKGPKRVFLHNAIRRAPEPENPEIQRLAIIAKRYYASHDMLEHPSLRLNADELLYAFRESEGLKSIDIGFGRRVNAELGDTFKTDPIRTIAEELARNTMILEAITQGHQTSKKPIRDYLLLIPAFEARIDKILPPKTVSPRRDII